MNSETKRVAVIPARGGSKRIRKKNIRHFWGHPLIAYTILAALHSELFEKVIVSTEDRAIADVAEWYGAEVFQRSRELADDQSTVSDVVVDVLSQLALQAIEVDDVCLLMPVCPLRISHDIVEHYKAFKNNARLFQISVVTYRGVYPHWAHVMDKQAVGQRLFDTNVHLPSQTLGKNYCPTGAVWWANVPELLTQKSFYGNPFHLEPIDDNRGLDIDTMEDWQLADLLVRGIRDRDGALPLETIDQPPYKEAETL